MPAAVLAERQIRGRAGERRAIGPVRDVGRIGALEEMHGGALQRVDGSRVARDAAEPKPAAQSVIAVVPAQAPVHTARERVAIVQRRKR